MSADLAAWLLADDGPIAEDERVAREALAMGLERGWPFSDASNWPADDPSEISAHEYVTHFSPARVLAECAAKRAIVEACAATLGWYGSAVLKLSEPILMDLAQPYAGRAGWREEWGTT